jgi:hypothetical protein
VDEIVLRGMAKWPDVPAVYGWLSLDRRGDWRIKGELIANPGINAFIGRNYGHDDEGRWFFQNGPQRVYVSLDYTPLIYRIIQAPDALPALECHTGKPVAIVTGGWLDETGAVLLQTEHGIGLVHDRDLGELVACLTGSDGNPLNDRALAAAMESIRYQRPAPLWLMIRGSQVRIKPIRSSEVPARFGFVPHPVQPAGQAECR